MAHKIKILLLAIIVNYSAFAEGLNIDSLKHHLPSHFSGQIYIKKDGATICNYSQGFTERIYGTPINDSTIFNLGELSHSFVYYFIQHLVALNQIKITDPVQKYIQNFPYSNINVNHLLNHESGLPNPYVRFYHKKKFQNLDVKLNDKAIRFDNDDIIELLSKVKPKLEFEPGDSTSYSDMNYLLLSSIIEKTTFTPFKDFSERLFKYQNFVFSPVVSAENDTATRKAYGYRYFEDESYKLFENLNSVGFPFSDGTNGNQHIYLSAKDLALWGQFLFKNMDTDVIKSYPMKSFSGGFKYDENLKVVVNKGAFGGSYNHLIYDPIRKLNIAITSNVFKSKDDFETLIKWLVTN
jgi:CubicO group peptidase (beta-lactamase class C family)